MLRLLGREEVPWGGVYVVQGHERIGPAGDPDSSLPNIRAALMEDTPIHPDHIYPMPVRSEDVDTAAQQYIETLRSLCGEPPVIDLVQLELFVSGRTAGLVPGDSALQVLERDVAVTGIHEGRRRMTLTLPVINRARQILWMVTGQEKSNALSQLRSGDPSIPASRVRQDHAVALVDQAAAGVASALR